MSDPTTNLDEPLDLTFDATHAEHMPEVSPAEHHSGENGSGGITAEKELSFNNFVRKLTQELLNPQLPITRQAYTKLMRIEAACRREFPQFDSRQVRLKIRTHLKASRRNKKKPLDSSAKSTQNHHTDKPRPLLPLLSFERPPFGQTTPDVSVCPGQNNMVHGGAFPANMQPFIPHIFPLGLPPTAGQFIFPIPYNPAQASIMNSFAHNNLNCINQSSGIIGTSGTVGHGSSVFQTIQSHGTDLETSTRCSVPVSNPSKDALIKSLRASADLLCHTANLFEQRAALRRQTSTDVIQETGHDEQDGTPPPAASVPIFVSD